MKLKTELERWRMERIKKINMSDREIMDAKNGIDRKSYGFRDPVVKHVVNKFVARSNIGYEKYGRTLDNERKGGYKNLAELIGTPIEECIAKAYDEIKNRKGKMDNGTFKKD